MQLSLLKPNSTMEYAEVRHDFRDYAIGEAGKPFEVQVKMPQEAFDHTATIAVRLYVEGQLLNNFHTLHKGRPSCTFKGYVSVVSGQQRYRRFEFSQPQSTASFAAHPSMEAGQLRVTFTHVLELSRGGHCALQENALPRAASQRREGKTLSSLLDV